MDDGTHDHDSHLLHCQEVANQAVDKAMSEELALEDNVEKRSVDYNPEEYPMSESYDSPINVCPCTGESECYCGEGCENGDCGSDSEAYPISEEAYSESDAIPEETYSASHDEY